MTQIKLIKDFLARDYQQSIFANSLDKNSLVVLPTGLGKTVIALMLSVYYFNKSKGEKKVLFLAPTKPLVEQQQLSFENFFENSKEFKFQTLTGLVSPKKREELYKKNDFIFSTPQLIENDIINNIVNPSDFCLVIIDEAHRATGNYSYCFIAEQFEKANSNILALTASPGTSLDQIREVMENLKVNHVEVKSYDDKDVKPYVNNTNVEHISVELPKEFEEVKNLLKQVFNERIGKLKKLNCFEKKNANQITKMDLLMLQSQLREQISLGEADEDTWSAISLAAGVMKLQYGQELFESQEISAAYTYFHNFFRAGGDNSKAVQELINDYDFRDAYQKLLNLTKQEVLHPKLIKLKEIIFEKFSKNPDLKIIVFNQYRESAQKIVAELSKVKEIKPVLFVGQAKKGDFKLSQKDQKKVLDEFRGDGFNVLVSTSVGEEGLDIPKVDLVIFYEPVPSAIRTIQRIGRTGRFNQGNAIILQTLGTRDVITRYVADAKEKKMYQALEKIKNDINNSTNKKKDVGLNKFMNQESKISSEEKSKKQEDKSQIKVEDKYDDRFLIYVDNRENNDLIKELFNIEDLKVESKKLDVADIVISEQIAIERKAKIDFVNSIIDKRLFEQLINLAKNYKRPVLILEGQENLYSLRNLNPNVILSTLSAIAVDLRIPIIYTNSKQETAQMILTIARRNKKDKKEISLAGDKKSFSESQELEKFVSTIPKVNVMTAKNILLHFKSVKKLVNSTKKQLEECPGIGKLKAEFLFEFFQREYK